MALLVGVDELSQQVVPEGLNVLHTVRASDPEDRVSLGEALGWIDSGHAEVLARLPFVPAEAQWIESVRAPVLMDTAKARRELRWRPKHDAASTLREMVDAARSEQLIR